MSLDQCLSSCSFRVNSPCASAIHHANEKGVETQKAQKAQKLFLTPFKAFGIMICGMQSLGHSEFGRNFVKKSQCSWQDFFHGYAWPSCSALRNYGLDATAEGWVCMAGNPHSVLLQVIYYETRRLKSVPNLEPFGIFGDEMESTH